MLRRTTTDPEDNTVGTTTGQLNDGRQYRAEVWTTSPAYHLTILVAAAEWESKDGITAVIEAQLVTFCGHRYVRVELLDRPGGPIWSYNAVVCDLEHQYVTHMPLPFGVRTFGVLNSDGTQRWTLAGPRSLAAG